MTEPDSHDGWDVFISYAREDYQKARDLADSLHKCITSRGVPPRIFIDVDREGLPPGVDWEQYIEAALPRSRFFVALYSLRYFAKNVCLFELQRAVDLTKAGTVGFIPVLMEEAAKDKIWFTASKYNWVAVTHPNWFETLRDALGLRPSPSSRQLRFEAPVPDAVVNHTLPTVRVSVGGAHGAAVPASGEPISLTTVPPGSGLNGTLVVPTVHGTATFADLSFRRAVESVRLRAEAPGCEPVETAPIQVSPPAPQPSGPDRVHPRLPASGRQAFFPGGRHVAVLDGADLSVHALGEPDRVLGTARLAARPRLWARGSSHLAVADWTGRVVVAAPDGRTRTVDLARSPGLAVPGALAFDGDTPLVGMWNGTVWSLADEEPETVLEHRAGVQLLAVDSGGRLLAGDLDGVLTVYAENRARAEYPLERLLLGIHHGPGCTLIVGEHHIYRLDSGAGRPLVVDLPVQQVSDAWVGQDLSIVLNDEGLGVCFDAELGVHLGFRTVPGARVGSASQDGRLVVFEYPDGSHVLMQDGRIEVTSAYPLAISPDGRLAATSDGRGTLILPVDELRTGAEKSA
ncbi:toll/interleukin-1 receptor domain-containing protein [Amycolatopsis eburnea]|uniref:TIR domain-containing protein n=1 Tax=Amycolatopsis eburnea TaxID=2267691 RepID=A0A3R9F0A1_9PSEU|nr:toll/interleukin-1 receptor domain-containing protein [Amycolatopsis eburnea]RSD10340.1 TIR domain-containing protein [Amycolatopsis eburnea]